MMNKSKKVDSLAQIYEKYKQDSGGGDKGTRHSYIDVYEHILAPYRWSANHFLEVGIYRGHSLGMFREYFADSVVTGVDIELSRIDPRLTKGCNILVGDATCTDTFKHVDVLDVVIDDGSHKYEDQLETFKLLWSRLSVGGIYVVEDVQDIQEAEKMLDWVDFGMGAELIDLRSVKGRYDDIMVIFEKW